MRNFLYLFVITLVFCSENVSAQVDTSFYYMKRSVARFDGTDVGIQVNNKDSAEFIRVIMSPDSNVNRNLFQVSDFYLNGRPKLKGLSINAAVKIHLQGSCLEFYPNGRKKRIGNFLNGLLEGDAVTYYPNGGVYFSANYSNGEMRLIECRDSTGKILASEGNGTLIDYSNDFKTILGEGLVKNGMKEGEWRGSFNDTATYLINYKGGLLISGVSNIKNGKKYLFTKEQTSPEFKGGITAFLKFVSKTLRYPKYASEKGIQGVVIVAFTVDKSGFLKDIYARNKADKSLSEEAIRILKISPRWTPGTQYGIPTEADYSIPLKFTL